MEEERRMDKALSEAGRPQQDGQEKFGAKPLDWRGKISDHVAYALLIYTGLQIFVTMGALKTGGGSILPYFALVVLVGAVIPACRSFERRWEGLDEGENANPELASAFKRDVTVLWLLAIGLPFLLTGMFKGAVALF
jgi:hypothetical protein